MKLDNWKKPLNRMVNKLKDSRKREKEEEHLRKQLIANISDDLRQTHVTALLDSMPTLFRNNPSSPKAAVSVQIIVNKLNDVGKLLEKPSDLHIAFSWKVSDGKDKHGCS